MVWALYSKSQSLADIDLTLLDAIYIIQKMPGNKLNTGLDAVTIPCASAYRLDILFIFGKNPEAVEGARSGTMWGKKTQWLWRQVKAL